MHPIIFQIGDFRLYGFGLMVGLAFVIGFALLAWRVRRGGEDPTIYLEGSFWLTLMAIAGARLFYVFYFPARFFADPLGTLFSQGGLVWYGGMLGVIATVLVYCRTKHISFRRFADWFSPSAALGLAIGRMGCLLAGCCYGAPSHLPWAIQYPVGHETHPLWVHPTPIYESLGCLVIFGLLLWQARRPHGLGQLFASFCIYYGVVRFAVESVRGDRLVWLPALDLSASQVMSLVGIGVGAFLLWCWRNRRVEKSLASPQASRHAA
jgi:phosphatidylglycerol:prolipoprotein diacylglycerol transferase